MRIRFRFSKLGRIRFTSQRDVARMWERALRRARLPLAYTEGFSPRPQLSFGLALPTGAESLAEYLDVALDADRAAEAGIDAAQLPAALNPLLPEGIEIEDAVVVER
jgi:radical SAM-linked protein